MSDDTREYLRDLAMHVLAERDTGDLVAAEVAERMGAAAMAEGHPKRAWGAIDGWTTAGVLRRLENDGLVVRGEPAHSPRKGREEPTYRIAAHAAGASWPMPLAPARRASAPPAPAGEQLVNERRLPGGAVLRHTIELPAEDQPEMGECSRWAHLSRSELEALLDFADSSGDVSRAAALLTAVRSAG